MSNIGVMYPGMSFPLLVNKEKIGIFKVLGTLPMTTGQITSGTKIMIWKGSDEKTVGETLYPPILHPVIATPLQMKMVDDPALSNVVGRASKMIGNFMSYYTHLPHEATKGKMTFLLHGPCDKKAVVEGIGRTLGLPVASVDASSLIKDFPSDSVSQINTCIQRPESRDGPLLIFLDRFDELVPHNRCGSTVMTDITTTQLKLLLDDPWVIFGHRITILVVSVRWINLICPTILSRIRTRFYCGNDEKEGDWDGVGMSLLKLLETNKSIDPNSRWVVTNAILYGNTSLSKSDVTKLFAATQSFDSIVIDAMQVLKDFKNTGSKAILHEMNNMDRDLHVFASTRYNRGWEQHQIRAPPLKAKEGEEIR
ncbi:hypothetical protein OsJ_30353 [Oryza sativa Japonica Group]|uniref:ATPase AAA-type core domain-containing protein n=1 Tax=Oryza sativa subsp. japonica TaxID=39947 RepID=B9G539_ORYSJ|nr:hypothetical protein OsJ_30353 [Oryza sativa Japonica Group]